MAANGIQPETYFSTKVTAIFKR